MDSDSRDFNRKKAIKACETIFINMRFKDGFQFLKICDKIECIEFHDKKGIDYVNLDILLIELMAFWKVEFFTGKYSKAEILGLRRFQTRAKTFIRKRRRKHLQEDTIASYYAQHFAAIGLTGDANQATCSDIADFKKICDGIDCNFTDELCKELHQEFLERCANLSGGRCPSLLFGQVLYAAGVTLTS